MNSTILITNARVVNEGQIAEQDVLIGEGRIVQIGGDITAPEGAKVIDAAGKTLMPGMIDDQVHFREPGLEHKGDVASESAAAVAGGITSFMEMPNTSPPGTTREAIHAKYARAAQVSKANYAFYMGATNDNIDEIRKIEVGEFCGVKCFMGASTGNMLVDDEQALDLLFRDCPTLITTHCEDSPTINANVAIAREKYGDDIPIELHPAIRSEDACWKSSSLATELARRHDARLHVLHLTTAKEMAHFSAGPVIDKRITAEACVHHLWFSEADYASHGARIKCNPAVKTEFDRDTLRQAVLDDVIDVIATDHAPHLWSEKEGNYLQSAAGLPLVQHAFLTLLDHYHNGLFSLELIAKKTAHAVADCYRMPERGYIREGYWADLTLVDLDATTEARDDNALYKCGWTPFAGHTFKSRIDTTIVSGRVAYRSGRIDSGIGLPLEFGQQR